MPTAIVETCRGWTDPPGTVYTVIALFWHRRKIPFPYVISGCVFPVARIYSGLVLFALLLLISNIILGLYIGDWNQVARHRMRLQRQTAEARKDVNIAKSGLRTVERRESSPREQDEARRALELAEKKLKAQRQQQDDLMKHFLPMQGWQRFHFMLGVAAALLTVLVNSISVTYFIGTTRWCREVVEEYGLDPALFEQSRLLKRTTYPWALAGVFVILVIICVGAAADPAANGEAAAQWVTVHLMVAVLGTAMIGWAFRVQISTVRKNFEVIQEILNQVNTIRRQQNLEVAEDL